MRNVTALLRCGRAAAVAMAAMLVISNLVYGFSNQRPDVIAITVGELVLVGSLLGLIRTWRGRRSPT